MQIQFMNLDLADGIFFRGELIKMIVGRNCMCVVYLSL